MSPRGVLRTAFALSIAYSSPALAQTEPPEVSAIKTAALAYSQGCAGHVGRFAELGTFVRDKGFKPAHPELSAELLQGEAGDAWILPETRVGVAITVRQDGLVCQVLLRQAPEKLFRDLFTLMFTRMFEGSARGGIEVSELTDDATRHEGQEVRTLAYRLSTRPRPPGADDWMFSLTTNPSPSARVAVTMTTAAVPPPGGR